MGKFRFLLLLLLSAFAIESGSSSPKSPEETYFAARDRFRLQFQASTGRNENEINRALRELETQLREMIGPVNIDGFSGPGAIALEAPGDGGANQVDGLLFSSDGVTLFVTTNTLLRANLKRDKTLPEDLDELSRNEHFYSRALDWEVVFTHFAEIPIRSSGNLSTPRAFLVLNAQDTGPYLPQTTTIFVARGDRILVARADLEHRLSQIEACKDRWDEFARKSSEAHHVYRSSRGKDRKALADARRYEEEGFEAYRSCFGKNVKHGAAFPIVTRQAQSIVDRLQKAPSQEQQP